MLDFIIILLALFVVGTMLYIQRIPSQLGGSSSALSQKENKYLYLARAELKRMFDHQLNYKTVNGSWLSVSFENMHLFDKDKIWSVISSREDAAELHPQTFLLPMHLSQALAQNMDKFILKKTHAWGRQGLKIADSKEELIKESANYDLAQVLIPNPDLINGYKYDIRMFLVVHHKYGVLLYKQSYFSYSNNPYDYNSKDMFSRIGGVHLTPEFYRNNRLPTRSDKYVRYPELYPQITEMLKKIFMQYPTPLLTREETNLIKIFGIDVNIFKNQNGTDRPMLIEMNSNPCLLFPEAEWKNKLIYNLVQDISQLPNDRFTLLRGI
jgi:hypothetical protein